MKKYLLSLLTLLTAALGSAAQSDPVAIRFKTGIADTYGTDNSFQFVIGTTRETYIDVDCGYGPVEYVVKPAEWDEETSAVTGTTVTCKVSTEGIVTIYGDPALVDYFAAEGCYIEEIDLGGCLNLDVLNLQHNELKALDLSAYTNLSAIYLTDNPFTPETPLVIGDNHPGLMILEVDIVGHISPDFDINTYPSLVSFDAYATHSLTHLDPTGCPRLARLSVDMCPITTLDVSKNTDLLVLNIEDTRITSIDLSKNTNLLQLYARNESGSINPGYKLSTLDVSSCPALQILSAGGNLLKSVDLSNNPSLFYVGLANNLLTDIDLSSNPAIQSLMLANNNMSFATLPLPSENFIEYTYRQRPMPVHLSYREGMQLDFSSKVLRDGTATDCVLYAYNSAADTSTPLDGSYYTYDNGKVVLLKEHPDSLYLSFGNTAFPEAPMTTSMFKVKNADDYGRPSTVATFSTGLRQGQSFAFSVGLAGATPATPRSFTVVAGGQSIECTATGDLTPAAANVTGTMGAGGSEISIMIPEGSVLTALAIDGITLYNADVTRAPELRELSLTGCELYGIDLSFNRCLRSLDLSDNNLYTLTLEGVNGVYGKNVLSDINLSHNNLSEITLNDTRTIVRLNLSDNKLTDMSYKDFDNLQWLDLSGNGLSSLDMTHMNVLSHLDLSGNSFSELTLPEPESFTELDLSDNLFTFASLPYIAPRAGLTYKAAPQAPIQLPTRGPGVNLSAQDVTVGGHRTAFTWKKADGTVLTPGSDYTIDGGVTRFTNLSVGDIYCEITNAAFPGFTGADALRTTCIRADRMPDNCLATFVTTEDGQSVILSLAAAKAGTAIYFDWSGTGDMLDQYILDTTYRLFDATTVAGATVKAYTYEPTEIITVFSVNGASMSSFDGSGLNGVTCLTIADAGLRSLVYPPVDHLAELTLDNNSLETFDITRFPALRTLSLNGNSLKTLDLTCDAPLMMVSASGNELSEITTGNHRDLWILYLSMNRLTEIDLSGLPSLEQLALSDNMLSHIDISHNPSINMLQLDQNDFTFATLPAVSKRYYVYNYLNQHPVKVTSAGGKVDLSALSTVSGQATDYRWYIGVPSFDENSQLVGEELVAGEEYVIENGVTTFLNSFTDVMCVMTNPAFPDLYLYTELLSIEAGVDDIIADADNGEAEIYTLTGIRVTGRHDLESGIYIVVTPTSTSKILVR